MEKSLRSSEWFLVGSLLLVMASLVLVAKVNAHRASAVVLAQVPEVVVAIDGAVAKPGEYAVRKGSRIEEIVRKARPKPYANLKKLGVDERVEGPLSLHIEELSEIVVSVNGAVKEPMQLVLPAGSRLCDLRSKISLTTEADKSFFRRRRLLKDGEKIEIPKKTVEENATVDL